MDIINGAKKNRKVSNVRSWNQRCTFNQIDANYPMKTLSTSQFHRNKLLIDMLYLFYNMKCDSGMGLNMEARHVENETTVFKTECRIFMYFQFPYST